MKDVFNETRTILEPAGAVAVAGAKAYFKTRPHLKVRLLSHATTGFFGATCLFSSTSARIVLEADVVL